MLEIKNLHAKVAQTTILNGLSLAVKKVKCMPLWGQMDLVKVHLQEL